MKSGRFCSKGLIRNWENSELFALVYAHIGNPVLFGSVGGFGGPSTFSFSGSIVVDE
jgi:hypothetical protein